MGDVRVEAPSDGGSPSQERESNLLGRREKGPGHVLKRRKREEREQSARAVQRHGLRKTQKVFIVIQPVFHRSVVDCKKTF